MLRWIVTKIVVAILRKMSDTEAAVLTLSLVVMSPSVLSENRTNLGARTIIRIGMIGVRPTTTGCALACFCIIAETAATSDHSSIAGTGLYSVHLTIER